MTPPHAPARMPLGPFFLRSVSESDRGLITDWIEQDPDHRGRVDPDFFLQSATGGEETVCVEDARGYAVFFFKLQAVTRIHIQFGPDLSPEARERNREAMQLGVQWLEATVSAAGVRELMFDSRSPELIRMAERRLSFVRSPDELRRSLPTIVPPPSDWQPLQASASASQNEVA